MQLSISFEWRGEQAEHGNWKGSGDSSAKKRSCIAPSVEQKSAWDCCSVFNFGKRVVPTYKILRTAAAVSVSPVYPAGYGQPTFSALPVPSYHFIISVYFVCPLYPETPDKVSALYLFFFLYYCRLRLWLKRTGKTILSGSPFSAYVCLSKSNANSIFSIRCDSSSAYTDSSTYDLLTLSRSI